MTALDAEVLVNDSPFVITSPNVYWVPIFDFEVRPLRARQDGRFGLENPFQHPQVLLSKHPMKALWWTPTQADYQLEQGSRFGGLGRLTRTALTPLCDLQKDILMRLHTVQEQQNNGNRNKVAGVYGTTIRSTLLLLQDCPMSYRDVVAQVAEFQRLLLDLNAILDFILIYEPHLSTPVSEFKHPDRAPNMCLTASTIMGCFTSDPLVVSSCLLALIPVWLIC